MIFDFLSIDIFICGPKACSHLKYFFSFPETQPIWLVGKVRARSIRAVEDAKRVEEFDRDRPLKIYFPTVSIIF